ncbi:hypothetical protein [Streptomyces sp. ALI-76-A]|jgi:hypothetical protein|uniref:hypothetical protein n=1 Tax=Streptomyces sp. ALI-76-A TaxID=3025736 RepID=UPI00256EAE7E|nr:hypothetical protein [Streptomyces sp. ALI-76-A]MDL5204765.1 hypothetical protein [Streptomyces sp. ALI-76-A]
MSQHIPQPPMPGFPPPPTPPEQKKGPANAIVLGVGAAVVVTIIATGAVVGSEIGDEAKPAPTVTVTRTVSADDAAAAAEDGPSEPAPEDTDDGVYAFDDIVTYENDVDVSLSGFTRGVSSEWASPEDTPYVKFTVKLKNGGDRTLDATMLTVNCSYGADGRGSEAIFDTEAGLGGGPDTRLLAGRSLNVPWGCELPKGEKLLQVEVAPDFESEATIFTGSVA